MRARCQGRGTSPTTSPWAAHTPEPCIPSLRSDFHPSATTATQACLCIAVLPIMHVRCIAGLRGACMSGSCIAGLRGALLREHRCECECECECECGCGNQWMWRREKSEVRSEMNEVSRGVRDVWGWRWCTLDYPHDALMMPS